VKAVADLPSGELDFSNVEANLDYLERDGVVSLADMSEEGITAIGSAEIDLTEGASCDVPVTRCAAKVSLEKVTNSITKGKYAGKSVTMVKVCILNGIGRIPLDGSTDTGIGSWFCCSGIYAPGADGMPDFGQMTVPELSGISGSWDIPSGQSLEHSFSVITGPNSVTDALETSLEELKGATSWQPRQSKLCVVCLIGEETFHYTIPLEALEAGTWYKITELELLHQGSKDPDKAIRFADVAISGQILTWDGKTILETI